MSSFRVGKKLLSKRLSFLKQFRQDEKHIWDVGCDHGLLGLSFLDEEGVESVNLVDPSIEVINTLQKKLKDAYISKKNLFIHDKQGQEIILSSSSNCIFIAGMGGKEIQDIIQHLYPKLHHTDRLVISPHRKILELRSYLHELPIRLLTEALVFEDNQYYQVLVLKKEDGPKVSLYGEDIWRNESGKGYLKHQILAFTAHQDSQSKAYVEYLAALT